MPNVPPYRDSKLPPRFVSWLAELRLALKPVPQFLEGDGSPEGEVTAARGTRYFRRDGSSGTWLYVKTTTDGNTGWQAYG